MSRNLFRRIEVAFPVLEKSLKKRIMAEGIEPYLKDNTNAWVLDSEGQYDRKKPRTKQVPFCAQRFLMEQLGSHLDH